MNDNPNARAREAIALTIGQLVLEKVEAQTAADFLSVQLDAARQRIAELTPEPAHEPEPEA